MSTSLRRHLDPIQKPTAVPRSHAQRPIGTPEDMQAAVQLAAETTVSGLQTIEPLTREESGGEAAPAIPYQGEDQAAAALIALMSA